MKLHIAKTQSEFFGLMNVRNHVFVIEQHVDPAEELDNYDAKAIHFVATEDGKVIGTCRVVMLADVAKLGRVAVLKEYRGKGIASALIRFVEQNQPNLGFTKMILGAQLTAIPFYEKNGFTLYGDVFLDANIKHKMMEKHYE